MGLGFVWLKGWLLLKKGMPMWRRRGWIRIVTLVPILLITIVLVLSNGVKGTSAQAPTPILDGKLDLAYQQYGTMTRYGDANIHGPTGLDNYAAAYLYILEDENYVYVFYHQDIFYANDNSYGANSLHWETRPSGMRDFGDIWESDRGEFTFEDAEGGVAAHFYVDQISPSVGTPSGYANLGISGGDGMWLDGYADPDDPDNFAFSSPMDYNLNLSGYCTGGVCRCGSTDDLLVDSPVASGSYESEAGCENWLWYNGWEIRVNKSVFGALGFGVVIGNHHNSPTKTCQKNKDCPTDLYIAYSSIGDRVWYDVNGDGVQDSSEPGLSGITVNLIDPRDGHIDQHIIDSQVTNSQGEYLFEELSHMYYIVQVDENTFPAGFSITTGADPNPDPPDFDSNYHNIVCGTDCIQRDEEYYPNSYYIELLHAEDYRTADFGYKPSGYVIGDYVWADADEDGVQDLGEPGIGGVLIELLDEFGTPIMDPDSPTLPLTATTNAAGWYLFSDLTSGSYTVQVASTNFDEDTDPLWMYELTEGPESSSNPTSVITLGDTPPEVVSYLAADFGYHKDGLGSIGDYVWFDTNNDGLFINQNEVGAEGVTIALYWDENDNEVIDTSEIALADTITNADGNYLFTGLELDIPYLVTVTDSDGVLDGFTITTYWGDDYPGTDPLDLDRYNDPAPVTLTTGETDVEWVDFGFNRPGSIGDLVWFDWIPNGVQDPGEIGVSGVTVSLSGDTSQITTTDDDGSYLFTELDSGTYTVSIVTPAGYDLSLPYTPSPHVPPIDLTGNESYMDADFGLISDGDTTYYTAGDLVWSDREPNGHRDTTTDVPSLPFDEYGIHGVTIDLYLDKDEDGEIDPTEPVIGSAVTGVNVATPPDPPDDSYDPPPESFGTYNFYGLAPGFYIIQITDNNNMLSGHQWTDGIDHTNNESQVLPYAFSVPDLIDPDGNVNFADFGFDPGFTAAYISEFTAYSHSGQVVVEWSTSGEAGTVGFHLFRQEPGSGEFVQVNQKLLPGLLHEPQGGSYRYIDKGARPGGQYTYKLIEVERNGREQEHGPFTVEVEPRSGAAYTPPSSGFNRSPHPTSAVKAQQATGIQGGESAVASGAPDGYQIYMPFVAPGYQQIPQVAETAKVVILEDGLYHLTSSDIAAAMNLHKWEAEELIKDNRLQITQKGKLVAYMVDEGNAGIHFYGWAIRSNYTKENVFWLSDGSGLQMEVITGTGPSPVNNIDPFTETIHTEQEQYPASGLFSDPTADFWFWDLVMAGDPSFGTRTFTLRSDGVSPLGSSRLTVNVHSLSDTSAAYDNHALVSVNGTQVGDFLWDGLNPFSYDVHFDNSLLNDGQNTIEITGILEAGVPYSIFYLDSFDLRYERFYRAVDDSLHAPAEDNPVVSIDGFSDVNIMTFDVTDPYQPKLITATTVGHNADGWQLSFEAPAPGSSFFALTRDQARSPISITTDTPSKLSESSNNYSYLVITPRVWHSESQTLATYRQGRGLSTLVVDLVDIYDEFNFGLRSPYAIKDFLTHAYNNWTGAPRYVVLAGEGTLDYQNNLGYGDNHVPPMLVMTANGLYPSDNSFVDAVGSDGLADMAIGRLPASTPAELNALISKIINYENGTGEAWQNHVLLLADDTDPGGEFPIDSDDLAALIPANYFAEKIYLSEKTLNDARQELIDGINAGAAFINYVGHAGPDRISTEGLLVLTDLPSLTNGAKLPVITAFTCYVGRFEIPGYDSIGEALVLDTDGGAVAVWAPTGLSINTEAVALGKGFITSIFQNGEEILGDAILDALQAYASGNFTFSLHEIYTLFGDPALRLKLSPQE
jgi:hypothetical protein